MYNAIERINYSQVDKCWQNKLHCQQPDSDLSTEERYNTLEQPDPGHDKLYIFGLMDRDDIPF